MDLETHLFGHGYRRSPFLGKLELNLTRFALQVFKKVVVVAVFKTEKWSFIYCVEKAKKWGGNEKNDNAKKTAFVLAWSLSVKGAAIEKKKGGHTGKYNSRHE